MSAPAPGGSITHRLARLALGPLRAAPITPNQLTGARLLTGLCACAALAGGGRGGEIWGGGLWLLSAFLDRADGELARMRGACSAAGHRLDFLCDLVVNGLFFLAVGAGLRGRLPAGAAPALGVIAAASVTAAALLAEAIERREEGARKAYPGLGPFDFDDALYLLGPAAWLGWLPPVLVAAALIAPMIAAWTWWRLQRAGGPGDPGRQAAGSLPGTRRTCKNARHDAHPADRRQRRSGRQPV